MVSLEVFIITYNRSGYLKKTLDYLCDSVISDYKITVLNNCSSDDTASVCEEFKEKFKNLVVVSHRVNIGIGANVMRAFELSLSSYTWILCDDDFIDLSRFDDVLDKISESRIDLIHVGAHPEKEWAFGGQTVNVKKVVEDGYLYFKFSSFIPCNIFKTKNFTQGYMIKGYSNIVNAYPHMPYLFDFYKHNGMLYISNNQIVTAKTEGQSYQANDWFFWWMRTCEMLKDENDVRRAFFEQWMNIKEIDFRIGLDSFSNFYLNNLGNNYVESFINKYLVKYTDYISKTKEGSIVKKKLFSNVFKKIINF